MFALASRLLRIATDCRNSLSPSLSLSRREVSVVACPRAFSRVSTSSLRRFSEHSRDRDPETKHLRSSAPEMIPLVRSTRRDASLRRNELSAPHRKTSLGSRAVHPSTTCDVVVQRRSLCRTCCVTRGSAASLSPHGQSPRSSLSLSLEGQIPPYRFPASTRPYSEIFCPLLPHLVSARPPARPPAIAVAIAIATACRGCRCRCRPLPPRRESPTTNP